MALTLAEANRAIVAALAKARDLQAKISVTVCDSGGHLMAHQRMDGVLTEAPFDSIGKAIGAATWGRPDQGASLSGSTLLHRHCHRGSGSRDPWARRAANHQVR
jgi:uncharacterized protein GlcG (DUF336 family)